MVSCIKSPTKESTKTSGLKFSGVHHLKVKIRTVLSHVMKVKIITVLSHVRKFCAYGKGEPESPTSTEMAPAACRDERERT